MHATIGASGRGFAELLRAEFTKFRTVRAWVIALCAMAVMFVLLAFLSASASRAAGPPISAGPGGEPVSDTYMFVHQTLTGDGSLTTRVASLTGAHVTPTGTGRRGLGSSSSGGPVSQLQPGMAPWAKAGIILEPSTTRGTEYAAVMVTGSHGVRMQYDYSHDSPGLGGNVGPSVPRWLRLTRAGDVVTGYDSTDGRAWHAIGSARLSGLPRTVQIGLFVTSPLYFGAGASDGIPSVATARFDDLSARGDMGRRSWTPDAVAGGYPQASAPTWQQLSAGSLLISGSGDIAPLVGGGVLPHWSGASIVNGTIIGLLVVIVLATVFVTSEYRRGLIRTTLAACPRRGRALAAKTAVAASVAFAAGTVATAIAEVITRHVFAANGNYLFAQSGLALAQVVFGTGLFLGLAAALMVALGTILRRSAVTVLAGVALLVMPGIAATSLPAGTDWLMRFTPTAAFAIQATLPRSSLVESSYTIANGYFPIGAWPGLGVLAVYAAAALSMATWLLRRRDA